MLSFKNRGKNGKPSVVKRSAFEKQRSYRQLVLNGTSVIDVSHQDIIWVFTVCSSHQGKTYAHQKAINSITHRDLQHGIFGKLPLLVGSLDGEPDL